MQQANGERIFCFLRQAEAVSGSSHLLALYRTISGIVKDRGSEENQGR